MDIKTNLVEWNKRERENATNICIFYTNFKLTGQGKGVCWRNILSQEEDSVWGEWGMKRFRRHAYKSTGTSRRTELVK